MRVNFQWMWASAAIAATVVLAGACVTSNTNSCGDLICPESTVCVPTLGQCYTEDLVAVCQGRGDGDLCTSADILDGHCRLGVCVKTTCGDGVVSGSEDCEDGQVGNASCESLNFYGGTVSCGVDCQYDTTSCIGFCGDGVKNGPEECDTTDIPPNSCLDFGFDSGKIGCSQICSTSFATCERFGWSLKLTDTSQYLENMWGQSASDYYAIGRGGLFRHFDGVEWSAALLSETRWRGIGGISPDDAWAVGRAGAMARRTADGWALVEDMGLIADLYDVLAVSGSDVWVVGRDATVLHFDGTTWSPVDVGAAATTDFKAIASNGSLIAISGRDDSYESVVFTYDGTTWTKLPFSSNGPMLGLHVTATGEIWSIAKQNSMVMHWDGTQWESFDLRALSGTYGKCHDLHYRADDSIYVACGGSQDGRPIWHYNGVDWVRMEWNLYGTARKLIDFGGKLYAGGARGVLAAFDRRGYLVQDRPVDSTVQPAVDLYMYGVSLVDRAMAITATNKGAAVWNGVTWTHSNLGTYTRAPCAIAKNLGYVAAGNGILYKYNGSTWQSLTMPAPMNTTSAQYMKASGPDNVWAASSSGGRAAQWNGTSWTGHTVTLPSSTRDLETFASNDTWISGYVGGLSHWDGTEWTADTFFTDMMEPPTVYSLGGVSSTDLYAGTSAGIYHRDAAGWSKLAGLPDTDTYYRYIVANRADDVYALLTSGNPRLYHYDGTAWTLIRSRIPAMSYMDAADGVVTIADSQGVDTLVEID